MLQSDIDKLLAVRSAWDKFKSKDKAQKSAKDYDDYYKVVWSHGIERKDEIARFNDAMCLQLLREYRTIEGECDSCSGYEGTPPCFQYCGSKSCFSNGNHADKEELYRSMLHSIRSLNKLLGYKTTIDSEAATYKPAPDVFIPFGDGLIPIADIQARELKAEKTGRYYCFCPEGHGHYCKYEQIKLGDIFDILWEP